MRILWLQLYYATPDGWGSQRTHAFARKFVAAGHTVDVLCSAAYDPSLAGRDRIERDGVRVFVSGTHYRQQMGFFRRVMAFLRFMLQSAFFVLRHGRSYDVMIASSGPLTMSVPALLGRWIHKLPFIFEVIDVWPDAAIEAGVLKNPVLKAAAFRLEALAYKNATRIVTCSTGMTARIIRKGVGADKVATIPNCSDPADFTQGLARRTETRREQGVTDGRLVVFYLGAMGRSNAIEDVCNAVRATADDARIVWWFAGNGTEAPQLKELAAKTGGRFFGCISSRERMTAVCAAADVGVISFMHAPLFYENSPNKFFDYIAAGLAVVFNRTTWLGDAVTEYDNGCVCTSAQPGAEMAVFLKRLAAEPETLERMRQSSRRMAAERFDHDRTTLEYQQLLESVQSRLTHEGRAA